MLIPHLQAWMKQRNSLTALRIDGGRLVRFSKATVRTLERQIVEQCRATAATWNDVVDVEGRPRDRVARDDSTDTGLYLDGIRPRATLAGKMSGSPRTLLGHHREDLRELRHLDEALQLNALALRERALRVALQETMHAIVEGTGEGRQLGYDRAR